MVSLKGLVVAAALAIGAFFAADGEVLSHHTGVPCGPADFPGRAVCLPFADSSPAVRTLQNTKALTYCFDFRAANYPGFVNQVRNVVANHEPTLGIDWIEISGTYPTDVSAGQAGCQVWMSMPDVHGCPKCGAWVHYLNRIVIIEFNWQAGITDFRTTIAHEIIHIYGLHEHYDDANFRSYRNTYGHWAHGRFQDPGTSTDSVTVMDSGVGGFLAGDWMTDYDLVYVCENVDPHSVIFTGCGAQEPDCSDPCWNGNLQPFGRHVFSIGDSWEPQRRYWWSGFTNQPEWTECNGDGLRWNLRQEAHFIPGHGNFKDGFWTIAPAC